MDCRVGPYVGVSGNFQKIATCRDCVTLTDKGEYSGRQPNHERQALCGPSAPVEESAEQRTVPMGCQVYQRNEDGEEPQYVQN